MFLCLTTCKFLKVCYLEFDWTRKSHLELCLCMHNLNMKDSFEPRLNNQWDSY